MLDLYWAKYDKDKEAKQFIVVTSDDGQTFNIVKVIAASKGLSYGYLLDKIINGTATVRIKVETEDGRYLYSVSIFNNNICDIGFDVSIYPNPIPANVSEVSLQAKARIFNGKFSIKITNSAGCEMKRLELKYKNAIQIKIKTGFLITGIYFVTLTGEDGKTVVLKFVKQSEYN